MEKANTVIAAKDNRENKKTSLAKLKNQNFVELLDLLKKLLVEKRTTYLKSSKLGIQLDDLAYIINKEKASGIDIAVNDVDILISFINETSLNPVETYKNFLNLDTECFNICRCGHGNFRHGDNIFGDECSECDCEGYVESEPFNKV